MRPAVLGVVLALLAVGRAAGGEVEAAETFRADVPDWWREAPELVMPPAQEEGIEVAALRGWADPSSGSFALIQVIDAAEGATAARAFRALRRQLTEAGVSVSEVSEDSEEPKAGGSGLHLGIETDELRGELVARTKEREDGALRIGSATCFYNSREPAVSRPLCSQMLESFEVVP